MIKVSLILLFYRCSALQNSGLAIFTSVVGLIVDNYGFIWSEMFFICSLSGEIVMWLILCVFIYWFCDPINRSIKIINDIAVWSGDKAFDSYNGDNRVFFCACSLHTIDLFKIFWILCWPWIMISLKICLHILC